jgi:protein involved in polysaccharide export with SLBB domain
MGSPLCCRRITGWASHTLSTPLNALYAAGGPASRGSLRHLRHYRGKRLVQEIDAYDLLLHGVHSELAGIQSGDTILVPPIGREVTVEGMVRRPAIYELGGEKNLAEVLQLAGGVLPSGTLRHVDVERLLAHEKRTMLRLDLPEGNDESAANQALEKFQVQDGDKIKISPILPYAEKTVFLDGHVFRPGKYPYRDGMKVTDIVRSYSDLLPEPSRRHAEVIRLQPPDYNPMVLAFNLGDAMDGRDQNLALKPFDTIRVFSRYDFEDAPVITVSGEVRDPGDHVTNGVIHRVQSEGAGLKLIPETDEDQKMAKQASLMQWQSALEKLENTEPSGRLVIQISQEIKRWANTSADVQLRAGDLVVIPKTPSFVMVSGAV